MIFSKLFSMVDFLLLNLGFFKRSKSPRTPF